MEDKLIYFVGNRQKTFQPGAVFRPKCIQSFAGCPNNKLVSLLVSAGVLVLMLLAPVTVYKIWSCAYGCSPFHQTRYHSEKYMARCEGWLNTNETLKMHSILAVKSPCKGEAKLEGNKANYVSIIFKLEASCLYDGQH